MIRIRDAPRLERLQYQAESYFDGKKRSFQAVVRGRFETPLPMKNCLTGQVFRRPGRLPSKWIVNSFLKIFKIVAPHLEVNLGVSFNPAKILINLSRGFKLTASFSC